MIKTTSLSSTVSLGQRFLLPAQPLTCSVRNSRKAIPIKKFREYDFDKKLLLAACEPVKKRETRPTWERCGGPVVKSSVLNGEPHPYDLLVGEELKAKISQAQMIVFYHNNIIMKDGIINNMNALFDAGFTYEYHNRMIYRVAFQNTKFARLVPLLTQVNSNALALSNETNVKAFLDADKKMVNCYVLFAYVHGRLVSKVELLKLAKMPSLKQVQGQLLSTLSTPGSNLAASISYQLSLLSSGLDARVKQLQSSQPSSDSKDEQS